MIRTWKVTETASEEHILGDTTSLDAITRQLPDGYYSTFRTFEACTRVLGLTAHLQRLYEPVSRPEVSASDLRRQMRALLEPYRPGEARVRVMMTIMGEVYIAIEPLKLLPREIYEKGVRVETTTELQRQTPRLKSTSFIGRSDAERKYIAQEGIFEALMVKNGKILEGLTSNFFYLTGKDILCTAREDILLGITRKTVIRLARGRGLDIRYEPLKRNQLATAREAFITSSSRGIVPVIQIDEVTIGQGTPGPVTKELIAAYEAYVLRKAERI